MKIKTSELTDAALDWAVAIANGINPESIRFDGRRIYRRVRDEEGKLTGSYITGPEFLFSSQWESGGPIIERERISIRPDVSTPNFRAFVIRPPEGMSHRYIGPTPLISAMRCFVASKLGDEVDVPEGLS